MPRLRYVRLPENPSVADIDAALAELRRLRNAASFSVVRGWLTDEINACLDLRLDVVAGRDSVGA